MKNYSRRKFIKKSGISAIASIGTSVILNNSCEDDISISQSQGKYMGDFSAPKIKNIKAAFIGVGSRGIGHVNNFKTHKDTEILSVCDLYKKRVENLTKKLNLNLSTDGYWGDENAWIKMVEDKRPDIVFISTNWDNHAPMAIRCMELGSHVFVEVPLANTIEDLWKIVNTSEKTQKHCMMLENVNYAREELMFLNICRQGKIGEFLHAEAAYIHDLRWQMMEKNNNMQIPDDFPGTGSWRTKQYSKNIGNLYPTHGLGPVAQYMSLARGDDNFNKIVSLSSPSRGRELFAKNHFPKDDEWNKINYQNGDINTSIIKTTYGKTIMIQWDETSPRPYTRHNLIQGTKGTLAGFPTRVFFDNKEGALSGVYSGWIQGGDLDSIYKKYDHPLYKRLNDKTSNSGHGGMDGIMMYRIIECLKKGSPLDQNVYEGAFWSAVTPLSRISVINDGAPQSFPDFTRGNWKSTKPLDIIQ
tara:strand:- start:8326 stop:9738 length:1413 start_codon:yes stop_codon:yes gene_type:complete